MDVNTIIESSINLVWNELKYRAKLSRDLNPLPTISCHPMQMSQVFMNLLVNATHAIEGRGEINISSHYDGGRWVSIAITDNGCGISGHVRSKIFEPFFTTKTVGQGTGLGLSISYDIVKEHGGDIKVASQPGQGATFTVRLPVEASKSCPKTLLIACKGESHGE